MTSRAPRPISPEALEAGLVQRMLALSAPALVLVDGAPAANPSGLAASIATGVRDLGRSALHLQSHNFWRDASVRLEYGREDVDAYLDWVDAAALRREVIGPLRANEPVLPALRDPNSNRSTRASRVVTSMVIISGELLLRHDFDPDFVVHLALSPRGLKRRTPEDQTWTLPAFTRYEQDCTPAQRSDVVVRCDDARHPAVLGLR